jgi:hypothetical protein
MKLFSACKGDFKRPKWIFLFFTLLALGALTKSIAAL